MMSLAQINRQYDKTRQILSEDFKDLQNGVGLERRDCQSSCHPGWFSPVPSIVRKSPAPQSLNSSRNQLTVHDPIRNILCAETSDHVPINGPIYQNSTKMSHISSVLLISKNATATLCTIMSTEDAKVTALKLINVSQTRTCVCDPYF